MKGERRNVVSYYSDLECAEEWLEVNGPLNKDYLGINMTSSKFIDSKLIRLSDSLLACSEDCSEYITCDTLWFYLNFPISSALYDSISPTCLTENPTPRIVALRKNVNDI